MKRKTFVLWKRILVRLSIVSTIFILLYAYFFTNVFSLQAYVIEGADDIQTEIIIKKARAVEQQKIFGFLPGNSFFTYHRSAIHRIIFDVLPNTKSVSIYPPSLHTLQIKIISHKPLFKTDARRAITEDGVVYTEIKDLNDIPQLQVEPTVLLTGPLLQSLAVIYPKISQSLFPVTKIIVNNAYDIALRNETLDSEVRYTYGQSVDTVWSNIVSAIDTEPLKSKLKIEKENLRYLDARFGNKVFYKFTNGDETSIINNHNATSTATPQVLQ